MLDIEVESLDENDDFVEQLDKLDLLEQVDRLDLLEQLDQLDLLERLDWLEVVDDELDQLDCTPTFTVLNRIEPFKFKIPFIG
jgi:hypothetical protein